MAQALGTIQVISSYSLLQSSLTLESYVKTAQELGYSALALTDINVMYGALHFYQLCQKYHIKPLVGLTLQLNDTTHPSELNEVVLIAEDEVGYQSLLKVSTLKLTQVSPTNEKQLDASDKLAWAKVAPLLDHVAVILPVHNSYLLAALRNHNELYAQRWLEQLTQTVGSDHCYLGMDWTLAAVEQTTLVKWAAKFAVRVILANRVRYLKPTDYFATRTLAAIRTNEQLSPHLLASQPTGPEALLAPDAVVKHCTTAPLKEALRNNIALTQRINLQLHFPKTQLPEFPTPNDISAADYLTQLCQEGLQQRLHENHITEATPYHDRLRTELDVIKRMGFARYFLIVWDVTNFCHAHDILIGPGRGSAAGALVAYCLRITDVDPLQYHLLFERFLNEERVEMPDIDLDIPDMRRDEVLAYVHKKYGHDRMAQIITFATMGAKQALRDVCRVFGVKLAVSNEWSKAVGSATSLRAARNNQLVKNLLADSQQNRLIFATAQALEGLPRQASLHAAGVILAAQPLVNYVPLQLGSTGYLVTQYSKNYAEAVGLLKMDFLALSNLNTLEVATKLVKRYYGHDLKLNKIDLADQATLKLFATANTSGVFQFESTGIRGVLKQIHPTSFEDIVAIDALFRPGPMANIATYAKRKHHEEPVTYPVPELKPLLQSTYGIIIYQEQVMLVAVKIANFTLGQADVLRKAISKKSAATMASLVDRFKQGGLKNGYSKETLEQIWSYITKFGDYGFNRSHAVAYSKLAFMLAYIKCHYPLALFIPLLNAASSAKVGEYLHEARQLGIQAQGPSINHSDVAFSGDAHTIYFGLGAIKGMRRDFVTKIVAERTANGPFKSVPEFINRMQITSKQQAFVEALIYVGAFDEVDADRGKLLAYLPVYLTTDELSGNNTELLAILTPKQDVAYKPLSLSEQLDYEKQYLGTYVSAHPISQFAPLKRMLRLPELSELEPKQTVQVLGYVRRIKVIRTKTGGQQMAFVTIEDQSQQLEVVVFARLFRQVKATLKVGRTYLIKGTVEQRNGLNLLADQLELAANVKIFTLYLQLHATVTTATKRRLYQLLQQNPGTTPIVVYYPATKQQKRLSDDLRVNWTNQLNTQLTRLLGAENVVLRSHNWQKK